MKRSFVKEGIPSVSTFSIIAYDEAAGEWGVAVQSKFLAAGSAVPWAAAETGAIATQSFANTSFGPRGLRMLEEGLEPEAVLWELLSDDPDRQLRQVGIVDAKGRSAAFTGSDCFSWAGEITGPGFVCLGNLLAGESVLADMVASFRSSPDQPLAERLVDALVSGQQAGGDKRGMQSASLLIVKPNGGYGGFNDRAIDLRVDDHPRPLEELSRLLNLHHLYFDRPRPEDLLPLEGKLLEEVRERLHQAGYKPGDGEGYDGKTEQALKAYYLTENFEERWMSDPVIDRRVLEYMRNPSIP
ncbi:DUF1028 domain-containing protein [Salinithrix halophila]|uniref:DUF1028 domain-containing protein n=1 Tax=Salinithrix halophila TaxID=1485204 RepID=A0ABV8JCQ7_9BACL